MHHCVHQAAAFLSIYNNQSSPLHHRFERSLWNVLSRLYCDQLGSNPDSIKHPGKGNYTYRTTERKFAIKGKNAVAIRKLDEIFKQRKNETEETSLKFSNLSQEEIALWKAGKPSQQLAYELSFWNDIAKWLMFLQEEQHSYEVTFQYGQNKLPKGISIVFPEVECSFSLLEEDLISLIPALSTVKTSLSVHHTPLEEIEKILYKKEKGCFEIYRKQPKDLEEGKNLRKKGIPIGNWIFVPEDGFYSNQPDLLLSSNELCGEEIERVLNTNLLIVKNLLKNGTIHVDSIQQHYGIFFDSEWTLHIEPYLFHPGDLRSPHTKQFGSWVYLEGENGFYRMEKTLFEPVEKIIPAEEVAAFVSQNRTWLNAQEGFQTHLSPIEAYVSYHLDENNHLSFSRKLTLYSGDHIATKDFGRWVYIAGHGFFSKVTTQTHLPIQAGISLNPAQIAEFIKSNRNELHLVPNFFSEKCPVQKAGLDISLVEEEKIIVSPEYILNPDYQNKEIRFFDDVTYVSGEGFYVLPPELRLPEKFRHVQEIESDQLEQFLSGELKLIMPYLLKIDPRLEKPELIQLVASSIDREDNGLYNMKLQYKTEKGEIPVALFWTDFQHQKKFIFSSAGLISLLERRFQWVKQLGKDKIDRKSNRVFLSALELLRLNAFEEIKIKKETGEEADRSKRLLKELIEFKLPNEPDLKGLKSILRPYQQIGVRWLWFLYHHHLSGLLCDDMGLGKTHQTMALFQAICNLNKQEKSKRSHFLVVCPTSVIYHWQEKLQEYLPNLKVWTFHGSNRKLEAFYEDCDILLTSYGIWRNECENLNKLSFEVAVFDEIQVAKNYQSRIHTALLKAKARMRLGLTGTPIENRLRELKSLFDIVLPTYMPSETDYKEYFVNPIEKEGNEQRKQLLSRLVKPFVLRRKKESVLEDLPEKIEEIAHCDLSPSQRQLYVEVLTRSREKILEELKNESNPVPYIHIFALLSHLKQICDHPAVFLKKPEDYKEYRSGKWDLFLELLNEARESQQKVVVFSQYLMMLDIIELHLKESHIEYATIRGATVNRGEQLKKFSQDPSCEVFLGSLQAAGLGVDLTAGSVVIHYDRWWNAARENQATDRVHRIGQKRGVQVFKLVTKDTVEEHIDSLILKKGKLMEEVMGIDDHQLLKKFDRKEMIQLLQMIPQSSN